MTTSAVDYTTAYQNLVGGGYSPQALDTLIIRGSDAAVFLHNLSTANIKALTAGKGCELFFTSVKGKTLGYGWALVGDALASGEPSATIAVLTSPGQAAVIAEHLDRYLITEDAELIDASTEYMHFAVVGPETAVAKLVSQFTDGSTQRYQHESATDSRFAARLVRTDYAGETTYLLSVATANAVAAEEMLAACGLSLGTAEALEALRIEAGTPVFGQDVTADNLPQEISRDELAISFKKGCYLGQETVARLDALGHVNKLLVKIEVAAASPETLPAANTALQRDAADVGRITSVAWSPSKACGVGLAMVRRGSHTAGTVLDGGVSVVK